MQAYSHYPLSKTHIQGDELVVPRRLRAALALWLPILLFGAALWAAQHDLQYASASFTDDEEVDLTPTARRQITFVALGVYGAAALLLPSSRRLAINKRELICLLSLCLLIMMSAFWSDTLEASMRRSLIPVFSVIAALGAAKHWQPRQVCLFTLILTSIFLLLGIGAEIANGTLLNDATRRFAGTLHPNSQGVNCAALALAALALYRDPRRREVGVPRMLCLILFGIGTLFLLLTKSRTATVAFLVGLMFLLTIEMSRGKKLLILAVVMMAGATALLGVFAFGSGEGIDSLLLEAVKMGRDQESEGVSSLTGRIPIWQEILKDVAERPILGYGYGGFWTDYRVVHYSYIHDWEFTHAHSAYIETLLHLGVVGLLLGLILIVPLIRTAEQAYRITKDSGMRLAASILAMALVHGLLDANFVNVGLESVLAAVCIAVVVLHGGALPNDDATSPVRADEVNSGRLRVAHA